VSPEVVWRNRLLRDGEKRYAGRTRAWRVCVVEGEVVEVEDLRDLEERMVRRMARADVEDMAGGG